MQAANQVCMQSQALHMHCPATIQGPVCKQAPHHRDASWPACGSRPSHALDMHALALLWGGRRACGQEGTEKSTVGEAGGSG